MPRLARLVEPDRIPLSESPTPAVPEPAAPTPQTASIASACPSCQAALNGDSSQADLARGIYYSILFMMSMPYIVLATFISCAYYSIRRARQRLAEADEMTVA